MGLLSYSSLAPRFQLYSLPWAETGMSKDALLLSSSIFLSSNSSFPPVLHEYWHPEFKETNPHTLRIPLSY